MKFCTLLALLPAFTTLSLASPGDQLIEFQYCQDACEEQNRCPGYQDLYTSSNPYNQHPFEQTPLFLSFFLFWDCASNCDYQCQQIITEERVLRDFEIYQFHGKWPFIRRFTMQEFFATVFSILNFIPHYYGFLNLKKRYDAAILRDDRKSVLLRNYIIVSISGMMAWTASTIFHWRDLVITEKFDYFFAGCTVCLGFHAVISRILRLDKRNSVQNIFSMVVSIIFFLHILRLYIDWSYTYNMRFNIFFGLLQYISLIGLGVKNYMSLTSKKKHKFSYGNKYNIHSHRIMRLCAVPILLVIGTSLVMSLELNDFFSYTFQIDAHAIWHAGTVIPSFYLYQFFTDDYEYLGREEYD